MSALLQNRVITHQDILNLCQKICIQPEEATERELFQVIEDLNLRTLIYSIIKNTTDPMILFVLFESLNKVCLKDTSSGTTKHVMFRRKETLAILVNSSDFRQKKELIEFSIEFLKLHAQGDLPSMSSNGRGQELPEMVINSVSNLIGNGLKLFWIELLAEFNPILQIIDEFTKDLSNPLLILYGKLGLTFSHQNYGSFCREHKHWRLEFGISTLQEHCWKY